MFKDLRLANYCWMLIEGFNFHHMVAFMFNIRHDLVAYRLPIYLLGWVFPQLVMIIYVIIRLTRHVQLEDRCWTQDMGGLEYVYLTPILLCFAVITNCFFFINL